MEQQTARTNIYSFPMDCTFNTELANRFVDGEMTPFERAEFEAHLKSCETCAELVSDLQALVQIAPSLARETMPDDARRRLREALRERTGYVSPLLKTE